jgi:FHS family L-fucose permease-like MFS transporter
MSKNKKGLFVTDDGTNLMFTFMLVSSLFLLWGLCNGLIDTMDKHFQKELNLTLSQSAWVQFAHYLGYFLMSMPAGWLATKLGYKGGIVAGLLMVAVGGFWFIPATHIAQFWAFLLGVCLIASGLTFLETIANPYTTVLGDRRYAATRINLAQSANGVGWIFGPIIGSVYFYSKNAAGESTGSQTLYIPYFVIGLVVVVLAVIFYFANVPDIKSEDDYELDEADANSARAKESDRKLNHALIYFLALCNSAVLMFVFGMILWLILSTANAGPYCVGLASHFPHPAGIEMTPDNALLLVLVAVGCLALLVAAATLIPAVRNISHHSTWSHPHFPAAILAQFFYVAAQAGIFSFFINSMTPNVKTGFCMVPPIPEAFDTGLKSIAAHLPNWGPLQAWLQGWFEMKDGVRHISDAGGSALQSMAFVCFLAGRIFGSWLLKKHSAHKVLAVFGVLNIGTCLLIFANTGWVSTICVFLSFFFMSIMFPTIFALGIFGLGARAKKASAFIVMAIMGGAILPKLMGYVADQHNMAQGYVVPMACFAVVALYGFLWPLLSGAESLHGASTSKGH